jgi:hypothetical protein
MESGNDDGDRNSRGCGSGDCTRILPSLGQQLGDLFHRVMAQAG